MNTYRCYDILTENNEKIYTCVVNVPERDLSDATDRYENLIAVSGALESLVGPVETFSYERVA